MPFDSFYLGPDGRLQRDLDESRIRTALQSGQGLLWVNIFDTTPEDGEFLKRVFNFHHLAIEDCVSPSIHPPKIDDYEDYLFIVGHGVNFKTESTLLETIEVDLFVGRNFVVSNHNFPLDSMEVVRRLVLEDARPMRRGADFMAHAIIDAMVDDFLPVVDLMGDRTEQIEEDVIRNPQPIVLETIVRLKRSTMRLNRAIAPQRELLNRLSRGDFKLITKEAQIFFADVYDHTVHIAELNQTLRERTDNALSIYLSAVANRQNETMKVLSAVAVIFMPLTVITGIYGMNFENMPELGVSWAYYAVVGFMGTVVLGALAFFWGRNWFHWGRK